MKHLLLASLFLAPIANAATIDFYINNVKNNKGKIYVQLFKGEENYTQGKAYSGSIVKASEGIVTITFNDVEQGEYAIRYFHDENDNGELETNLFGMPTEGYGYSNNAKANFGPADYADMRFQVSADSASTQSTVTY